MSRCQIGAADPACTGCEVCMPRVGSWLDHMRPSEVARRAELEAARVKAQEDRVREIVRGELADVLRRLHRLEGIVLHSASADTLDAIRAEWAARRAKGAGQ